MPKDETAKKHGARIYYYNDGVIQVAQTIMKSGRYVLDMKSGDKLREKWVNPGDDASLLAAIRAAGEGML